MATFRNCSACCTFASSVSERNDDFSSFIEFISDAHGFSQTSTKLTKKL